MLKALIIADQDISGRVSAVLADLLDEGRLFDIETNADIEATLLDLDAALDYDLFVIHGSPPNLTDAAQANFEHSLRDGAGLLIIHGEPPRGDTWSLFEQVSVCLADPEDSAATVVRVHYLDHYHPVARGVRDFSVVTSLPTPLNVAAPPVHTIIANAAPQDSIDPITVMISTSHGRGRIFHSLIGGVDSEGQSPIIGCDPLRHVLTRAAEWAATGNVLDF